MAGRSSSQKGAALIELAISLPLLVAILVGTVDFARVFYAAIEATNGARAGAQYGAYTPARSADAAGMRTAAIDAAPNLPSLSASSSRSCQCAANDGSSFTTAACTASCPAGQHLFMSVTVTTSATFTTIARYPGIPSTISLTRTATMPVAQ